MSGAVAVFININMWRKATQNSGCDVVTPLKTSVFSIHFLSFPSLPSLSPLRFASVGLRLTPDAITMTNSLTHDACRTLTLILFPA